MKVAYFVFDDADAAVARRVRMLETAGVRGTLFAFRRAAAARTSVGAMPVVPLGRTHDARLGHRALSVVRALAGCAWWGREARGADAFMARNLECLLLAVAVRWLFAPRAPVTYEALDIHRAMLGSGRASRAMRALEAFLLRRCQATVISSPAFELNYFDRFQPGHPPSVLIENKVLVDAERPSRARRTRVHKPGEPWRIGWFGVLRCRRSLVILTTLARTCPGLVQIDLRGRIATTAIPDFDELIAGVPGVRFHGAYRNPEDLEAIYGEVDFTWAIDMFEQGLNSTWLLPNRLYEGCLGGAVPIALAHVETGQWLRRHGLGIVLETPEPDAVADVLTRLTDAAHAALQDALDGTDASLFACTPSEAKTVVMRAVAPAINPLPTTSVARPVARR